MKWTLPGIRIISSNLVLLCFLAASEVSFAQTSESIGAGLFSSASPDETLPDNWQPLVFEGIERHTDYSLVEEDGAVVVKAVSNQSASGLTRAMSVDAAAYPIIQWRWKVENILEKGDVKNKSGDDYPARIYITFAIDPDRASFLQRLEHKAAQLIRGPDVPYRAISYIWGSNSPAGTMIPNAYTGRAMMFVVQGGPSKLQQWLTQERNVFEDYKAAFGEEPALITGVAIMTDTDNTQESAVAWYGDIIFRTGCTGTH